MAKIIHVRVITNEGQAIADEATSVRAPGELGSLGFLYNHAPLVTTLVPGPLMWKRPDGQQRAYRIGAGLLEIVRNHLTVLTDSVSEESVPSHDR